MKRVVISAAAGLAGVTALWIGGVVWLNATVYAPQTIVEDYLEALESGDITTASALAGLDQTPLVTPGLADLAQDAAITGVQPTDDGRMLIQAGYTLAGKSESSVFTVEPRPKIWGLFDQWGFSLPPTATISATVSGLDTVTVSGVDVSASDASELEVLVPAQYSTAAGSQWLESPRFSTTISEPGSTWSVELDLRPTDALIAEVSTAIDEYLAECAMRQVLQPASCPFGVRVIDRLAALPTWSISETPALSLEPTADPTVWEMVALGGEATIEATLQSIFDGSLRPYIETVSFGLTGSIVGLDTDSPALRID